MARAVKRAAMTLTEAATLLGQTLAKVATEDAAGWAAETCGHYLRHGYHRRYRFVDLEARGGPPATTAGQVMRRFPELVQAAAGARVRVYLRCGKVQIDPVVPKTKRAP